jgi:hypothetical protein
VSLEILLHSFRDWMATDHIDSLSFLRIQKRKMGKASTGRLWLCSR